MAAHIFLTHLRDPVVVEVDTTLADGYNQADYDIAQGDLVSKDDTNGYVNPVNFPWDSNLTTTQTAFAAALVGVSADRVRAGHPASFHDDTDETKPLINQDGTYNVHVENDTYAVGDFIGPSANGGGDGLINQCEAVASKALACFVVQEDKTTTSSDPYVQARLINTAVKR